MTLVSARTWLVQRHKIRMVAKNDVNVFAVGTIESLMYGKRLCDDTKRRRVRGPDSEEAIPIFTIEEIQALEPAGQYFRSSRYRSSVQHIKDCHRAHLVWSIPRRNSSDDATYFLFNDTDYRPLHSGFDVVYIVAEKPESTESTGRESSVVPC